MRLKSDSYMNNNGMFGNANANSGHHGRQQHGYTANGGVILVFMLLTMTMPMVKMKNMTMATPMMMLMLVAMMMVR